MKARDDGLVLCEERVVIHLAQGVRSRPLWISRNRSARVARAPCRWDRAIQTKARSSAPPLSRPRRPGKRPGRICVQHPADPFEGRPGGCHQASYRAVPRHRYSLHLENTACWPRCGTSIDPALHYGGVYSNDCRWVTFRKQRNQSTIYLDSHSRRTIRNKPLQFARFS